jgi:hypothetical protein
MDEKSPTLEILEPTSPESLIPASGFAPWILGGVALLIASIMAYAFYRWWRNRCDTPDPEAARRAAWLKAGTALEGIATPTARDAAVEASLILRRYLSLAAGDPALFETHEEFVSRHDALSCLSQQAREACARGFSRLATLKYASDPSTEEPSTVVIEARALLDTLHHGFKAS